MIYFIPLPQKLYFKDIMKELIEQINALCDAIKVDIVKTENKAAQARVRKATLNLEKLGKIYRKETCKK